MEGRALLPLPELTRLLAEMQTSIAGAGVRFFGGNLDRFVIFTLIVRETALWAIAEDGAGSAPPRPIATYSIAQSLRRSFETVRRHVNALVADGLCERTPRGIAARADGLAQVEAAALLTIAHDSFVRFVEDLSARDLPMPQRRRSAAYDPPVGVRAAADIMLAVLDGNIGLHREWLDLCLFSVVYCANHRHDPPAPVRAAAAARALGIPHSTAQRRFEAMIADGILLRERGGLRVSDAWLARPEARAVSAASLDSIRRILTRIANSGFPFDAPATAYIGTRPPAVEFV